jgi:NADH-quinone oxidoreductase subunit C
MTALELAQRLKSLQGNAISSPTEFRGEVTMLVGDAESIVSVCQEARSLGFDFLLDITGIDNYGEDPRWTVVYHLYHLTEHVHLRLKTSVTEEKSEIPTVSEVWATADWHEREIYDMLGLRFRGHPDLRRILMWEGYPHYPLRKDFPLAGKPTELPDVAFTQPAPLEGGPFVTSPGGQDTIEREPRAKSFGKAE